MSPVTLFARGDSANFSEITESASNVTFTEVPKIRLRRTGKRPFTFDGVEVCSATSHSPGPSLWYEINLYRRANSALVCDVRFFSKVEEMKDRFHVFEADGLSDVIAVLDSYDPATDIGADLNLTDANVPTSEIALHAAVLRMRMDEARRQFSDLVGEILHQLDNQ